ncbi:MAG TPA: inositol monophosphatase [Cyanobacteria bacterium UBA8803]|nr:inositol monophosphatase [Cyanobacteria bacterium UBA9273]HBL62225.1 inositol monophosphatase [Cyanobacteria bacterium UBA8803]
MNNFWTDILKFSREITNRVGTHLLPDFRQVQASQKADGSLVTHADHWSDETIREAIASRFPSHGVLSEEGEHKFPDTDWCWIIDPLDGTTNFTRGIPIWGISLGLLYRGTPVFGYVHFPPITQSFHGFWYGESGVTGPNGAFMNEFPIHSSPDELSSNHFFNLCSRSSLMLQQPFPCKIRMLGVASYNFLTIASGAALGGVEATPKIWDLAGAWVIVQAAGGMWVPLESEPIFPLKVGQDYSSQSFPTLVVSRSELVDVFKSRIQYL